MHASVAQLFLDWSEPAVLVQVSETFDPATGERSETVVETNVTVIPTELVSAPVQETARQQSRLAIGFHVRPDELPADFEHQHLRVRHADHDHEVLDHTRAAGNLLVTLHALRL